MKDFFWPDLSAAPDTVLKRLGRVCFYVMGGIAALIVVAVALMFVSSGSNGDLGAAIGITMMLAAPLYLGGRALCYILAGD